MRNTMNLIGTWTTPPPSPASEYPRSAPNRYRNRPESHHYWGGLHNCLLKAFVSALLVGLIPSGEIIWPSNVRDEPRWRGSQ